MESVEWTSWERERALKKIKRVRSQVESLKFSLYDLLPLCYKENVDTRKIAEQLLSSVNDELNDLEDSANGVFEEYEKSISDSRRVKDANLNSYGYEDNGGYYGEDFELADEEDDEVIELTNNYLELVEQYNIDFNKSSVEEFKNFYYAVIDMASNFDFINPQYIDDQLTEANYHTLNRCITIAGFFGEREQQQLVDSWKRDLKNIKQYMNVPRMKAFTEIMQDMGLI